MSGNIHSAGGGLNLNKVRTSLSGALNNPKHPRFRMLEWAIITVTSVSVLVTIISTVPSFSAFQKPFMVAEVLCSLFFLVEYLVRLFSSKDRLAYAFSIWGLADLLSFLPILAHLDPAHSLVFAQQVKILLAFRSLRVAKLARAYILESRSEASEDPDPEHHHRDIPVSVYFLTQITVAIFNGAVMYDLEGAQEGYSTMPLAILEVTKILLDTDPVPPETVWGRVFILFIYFQRLCLLGLLIDVMGGFIRRTVFGHSK
jgi:voltage-gated potassium channel